ncbi:MAG: hypothetical protein KDD66_09195 [Bdellovibrionales bacterium]|nr:hypothetical protein [Bdellovibrionales bacterium]
MANRLSLLAVVSALFIWTGTASAAPRGKVYTALSVRHADVSTAKLTQLAGGENQLVSELLTLRRDDSQPFISTRSEKLLLEFAARDEVSAALEADLRDPEMAGLARIIAVYIDDVPNPEIRRNLALLAIERSKRDSAFLPYARGLKGSKDKAVAEMARKALN